LQTLFRRNNTFVEDADSGHGRSGIGVIGHRLRQYESPCLFAEHRRPWNHPHRCQILASFVLCLWNCRDVCSWDYILLKLSCRTCVSCVRQWSSSRSPSSKQQLRYPGRYAIAIACLAIGRISSDSTPTFLCINYVHVLRQ
jgi:hypothetical protein